MLWIDKHQPRNLADLTCHPELTEVLERITQQHDLPHLLFYGPSGGGKKTRIMAVLRQLFGTGVDKVKAETVNPEGTNAEFVTCSSAYHNQISAPELGYRDRVCVQMMIKQLASQVSASTFSFSKVDVPKFRVFVIQEAEVLSVEAQAGLRRTLEKYVRNARVILHCQQLSSIILPLQSRCFCIRVPLPSENEIVSILKIISQKECLTVTSHFLAKIATASRRNTRRAILMLEEAAVMGFPASETLANVAWEEACADIARKVLAAQNPKCLLECRERLYDILCSCIPGDLVIETICRILFKASPDAIKLDILRAAAHYSNTMKKGSKEIWHCEAFLAQCMNFISLYASLRNRA